MHHTHCTCGTPHQERGPRENSSVAPVTLRGNAAAAKARRIDPTRLGKERRAFSVEVRKRFGELRRELVRLVLTEDEFGLAPPSLGVSFNARRYKFQSSSQKVETFNSWLQSQIDSKVLGVARGENAWSAKYIDSAFRKGLVRSYLDTHKRSLAAKGVSFYKGGEAEFLRSAFASPESIDKIRLIGTRTFNGMKGLTEQMKTRMGTALADGVANGLGPREVARRLVRELDITRSRALTIARTEMTAAHAEGQLLGFAEMGMDELEVMAEWLTAGDDRVCGLCAPLEGQVFKIDEAKGMIPRHPNCRCAWMPAESRKMSKKDQEKRARLLDKSVKAETGAKTKTTARKDSRWVGADV